MEAKKTEETSDSTRIYRMNAFEFELRHRLTKFQASWSKQGTTANPKPNTVEFEALPEWLQWNEFLHRGHRPPTPSIARCVKSIFSMHTETFNIWTHLLACLSFLAVLISNSLTSELNLREKLAFSPFILGLIICYGLSAFYHTVNCHSLDMCKVACAGDYVGIVFAALGIVYSSMFYIWWCRWYFVIIYCLIYSVLGFLVSRSIFRGTFYEEDTKYARGVFGGAVVASGLLCLFHDMAVSGFWFVMENYPVKRAVLAIFICIVGTFFYTTRIPESLWPGRFDIWFQSHQIFHTLVVISPSLGYHCLSEMAKFRATHADSLKCSENQTFVVPYDLFAIVSENEIEL